MEDIRMKLCFPDVDTPGFVWVGRGLGDHVSAWERILGSWVSLVMDYSSEVLWEGTDARDVPYWYGERSNTGILAAAAWKAGFPALEESRETKVQSGGPYEGRYDLSVCVAPARSILVEAKHEFLWFLSGSREETVTETAREALDGARDDAEKCKPAFGDRLGIAFLVPGVRRGELDPPSFWARLVRLVGELEIDPSLDICAWAGPILEGETGVQHFWEGRGPTAFWDGFLYPGVLLVGRRLE